MSAKFTLEGSSTGAVQAIQQAADALDKTGKAAEGAAKSTRQLTSEAQRIKESLDPQEKLNRKYQELQQHVEAGRLSISQATAAGIRYRQELFAASEEGKKAAAAAVAAGEAAKRRAENDRKSLQIQLDAGQRVLRLEKERATALAQAAREQEQLNEAARKVREAIDPTTKLDRLTQELAAHVKAGRLSIEEATAAHRKYRSELGLSADATEDLDKEQKKAFGDEALSGIASMASGYLSVAAAVGAVVGALKEKAAEEERAAQRAIQSRAGLGSLSQLASAEANPEQAFKSLVAEARGFVASGAAIDENEAGNLLFQLAGAGLNQADRAFAAELKTAGTLTNVGGAAEAYSALKTSLGESEVGTFRQFMSKSLKAAGPAPGSFEQLPIAAARSGGSAKALGVSDEFLLAATTILGKQSGSIDEGGTQLAAFLRETEKSGMKGLNGIGGMAIIDRIAALPEAKQGLGGVLGERAEAVQAFRTLRDNRAELAALMGGVSAAQSQDLSARAAGLPATDDQLAAARQAAASEGAFNVQSGETFSADRNLLNTIRNERRERMLKEGRTTSVFVDKSFDTLTDWTGYFGGESEISIAAENRSEYSPKTQRLLEDYMRRTAEAAERTEQQSRSRINTRPE